MVATGEHAVTMAARLGHSTPKLSLGLYGHAPEEVDRAAAERLGQLFAVTHDEPASGGPEGEESDGQLRLGFGN